jgi:hypothetical protein
MVGISAALVLLVGGCGGGDDSTTASLTKAQFVQKGNALCKEREQERVEAVQSEIKTLKPGGSFSDAEQTALVVDVMVPNYEKVIANVGSLGAPEGDEAEVEEILAAMEKGLKDLKADPEEAIFTTAMLGDANELAVKYGLSNCVV